MQVATDWRRSPLPGRGGLTGLIILSLISVNDSYHFPQLNPHRSRERHDHPHPADAHPAGRRPARRRGSPTARVRTEPLGHASPSPPPARTRHRLGGGGERACRGELEREHPAGLRGRTRAPRCLAAAASELAGASLSASTRRVYAGALALDGAPLNDAHLAAYLAMLFATGKSPATLSQAVAAARLRAKLAGAPSPTGPATDRMLAGARRQGRRRGRGQVTGVRWEQADAAAAVAARDGGRNDVSLSALRDAAIIAVMSDAMLRVSELAALECTDVEADPEAGSGRLTIRHSKTDPEGAGAVQYLGPATLERVRVWTQAAGASDGALFRRVRRGGRVIGERALSPQAVRTIVKRRAAEVGIEGRVSGHSLRVGAAQSLAANGASVVEMQVAGRWKSPSMPGRYARGELAARGAVARLRYGAGGGDAPGEPG